MAFLRTLWTNNKLPIKICLALGILAALASRMDWAEVKDLAADIQPEYFAIATLLISLQVLMLAVRWKGFMNAEETLVTYKEALNMSVASQLANFLFVTSVGGVILRLFLARHYGLSILKSICAVVADRFMTLFAMLAFAILFLPVLAELIPGETFDSSLLVLGIAIPASIVIPYFALKIMLPFIRRKKNLYSTLLYLKNLLRKPDVAVPIVVSSLLAQSFFFLAGCMAAKALGLQIDYIKFFALLPFISIASSLPIGFGGWGIREGSFIMALKLLDVPMESAFLISVQVGIISILGTVLIALPLIFTGDLQKLIKLTGKFGSRKNP